MNIASKLFELSNASKPGYSKAWIYTHLDSISQNPPNSNRIKEIKHVETELSSLLAI